MKLYIVACTSVLALSPAGLSAAAPATEVSPLALPIVVMGGDFAPPPPAEPYAVRYRPRRGDPVYHHPEPPPPAAPYPVRYQPRRPPPAYHDPEPYTPHHPEGFSQLHGGVQDVNGTEHPGVVLGFRGGVAAGAGIQLGGQVEWRHRGNSSTQVISGQTGPGGTPITVYRDLGRSSSDLVPMMAMIQIGGRSGPLMPYVGAGGGIEILHLSAEDFQTGAEFRGTFVGWGWQGWGGMSLGLSRSTRLVAEVYYNGAPDLSRDVHDPSGITYRESVNMDGAGARAGLAWGF